MNAYKYFIQVDPPNATVMGERHLFIDTLDIVLHRAYNMAIVNPHRAVTVSDEYGLVYARLYIPHPIVGEER